MAITHNRRKIKYVITIHMLEVKSKVSWTGNINLVPNLVK